MKTLTAQECRLGNYLYDAEITKNGRVTTLSEKQIGITFPDNSFSYGLFDDSLQGIPLTEELLGKAGFYKWPDGTITDGNCEYSFKFNSEMMFCAHNEVDGSEFLIKRFVVYLHQLQNLYFALTGQELQINL